MRRLVFALTLVGATLAVGCGKVIKDEESGDGEGAGFALEPTNEGFNVRFRRAALGARFLLSPALAKGPPLALSQAYPAKLVYFEQKGESVYLFEDLRGLSYTNSLPVHRLLASFPLIEEGTDSETLVIDFNGGVLSYLLALLDETGAGGDGALRVLSSYIHKAKAEEGLLFADQIVELELAGQARSTLAQVKYTLRAYAEVEGFPKRTLETAAAKVGFFESEAVVVDPEGRTKSYVNKWDAREPIVFHVPATIPAGYDQAVRDGILYWNKAFGSEIVKVETLPEGVTPHEPGYNVVQWLATQGLSYAYADWTSDPLTGRTLQAQVFIPSSFVVSALDAASQLQRQEEVKLEPLPPGNRSRCYEKQEDMPGEGLAFLAGEPLTQEQAERFAQDRIRALTAHEIGHALGLRHNFHAKVAANVPSGELLKAIKEYIATGVPPGDKVITNSVMDYLPTSFDAMAGAHIRLGNAAFKYDTAAIKWGYGEADFRGLDFGGFCTDDLAGARPDCVQYATPGEPIASNFAVFLSAEERSVAQLAARFTDARAPLSRQGVRQADEVALDPAADAELVLGKLFYVIQMLRDFKELESSFTAILDKQKGASPLTRKDEEAATLAYQKDAVKAMGGLKALFDALVPVKRDDGTWAPAILKGVETKFLALLEKPSFVKGKNAAGDAYELTAADLVHMKKVAKPYFKMFVEAFLEKTIARMVDVSKARWAGVDPKALEAGLQALAKGVILAQSTETETGTVLDQTVTVPKPYFSQDLQILATKLLSSNLYDSFPDDFNKDAGQDVLTELSERLNAITLDGQAGRSDLPSNLRKLALELAAVGNAVP